MFHQLPTHLQPSIPLHAMSPQRVLDLFLKTLLTFPGISMLRVRVTECSTRNQMAIKHHETAQLLPDIHLTSEGLPRRRLQAVPSFTKDSFWSIRKVIHVKNVTFRPSLGNCSSTNSFILLLLSGHNTGYKHYDPLHPCKKCWSKYAKPFSGPLVYSYSSAPDTSNTHNTNLQKPLPLSASEPSPSNRRAVPPPLPPRRASFSQYGDNPQYAPYVRGPAPTPISGWAPPPPGSVVFRPGDPRIGGMLCWLCHGKGTKNIFIDVINCPACDGCGRTFA